MCKISKSKRLAVFCITSAIVSLGVYVLISSQYPYTDITPSIYGSVHNSGSGYAVVISEQNQDVSKPTSNKDCLVKQKA